MVICINKKHDVYVPCILTFNNLLEMEESRIKNETK